MYNIYLGNFLTKRPLNSLVVSVRYRNLLLLVGEVIQLVKKFAWYLALLLITSCSVAFPQETNATLESAPLFGIHEITFEGTGSVDNPFEIEGKVTFVPPSGQANSKTVDMFYDGENVWRARVYVSEIGQWSWVSESEDDGQLNSRSGAFVAVESNLRGMLRPHPHNPRQWVTDDGQWFLNISDTAYKLFNSEETRWQAYIRDDIRQGITSVRSGSLGGWVWDRETEESNYPWDGEDLTRYDLEKFQTTDSRLQWMLDHYPNLYVQMILFGNDDWDTDVTGAAWSNLPASVRVNTMRYMIARWAAYPQIFWLVVNDMRCTEESFIKNRDFVREVGIYFANNDPWHHPLSAGPTRDRDFCYTEEEDSQWVSYIYLEGAHELGASWIEEYQDVTMPVFLGEDFYEQDTPSLSPRHPRFFQRWLFWSWLLAGGSANYGGRYPVIHPYSQSHALPFEFQDQTWGALEGLDSVPYVSAFFNEHNIDLAFFQSDDVMVSDLDGRNDDRRPKLARRDFDEFIIYHPNSKSTGAFAELDTSTTAGLQVDLRAVSGTFSVGWYRPDDGTSQDGACVQGGDFVNFTAPWEGYDVVLHLVREVCSISTPSPTASPVTPTPSADEVDGELQVLYTFDEGDGSTIHDTSGIRDAINLTIKDVSAVTWTEGGLSVTSPTIISSPTAAIRLIEAIRATNAMTIEAWIHPANTSQNGPARIITLSSNSSSRYFSLGQGLGEGMPSTVYDIRLRTTTTDANGIPSLSTTEDTLATQLSYVVYTRDASGTARIYVNGSEAANGNVDGDMSNWQDEAFHLALANELSLDRPWLGEYRFVAVYNRALSASEVAQNWEAGPERT